MITRTLRNRLAGIAVLLQVLAVLGITPGLVLCVGTTGHIAVEAAEAAGRCRESDSGLVTDDIAGQPALRVTPMCVDTPFSTAFPDRSTSPLPLGAAAMAAAPVAEVPRPEVLGTRARLRVELPFARARLLRTVVLLI